LGFNGDFWWNEDWPCEGNFVFTKIPDLMEISVLAKVVVFDENF
jgi:hypothetical protein